jgi:hypothetical protein
MLPLDFVGSTHRFGQGFTTTQFFDFRFPAHACFLVATSALI